MTRRFHFGRGSNPIPNIHTPLPTPPPLPALAQPPAWWTGDMEADRNTASHGCLMPESNCVDCKVRCPLSLRLCQTCGHFDSANGLDGACAAKGMIGVHVAYSCHDKWEARK